jgi:hypothetical protein
MSIIVDILEKLFSPILHELLDHLHVIVAVIPQASWDMSSENDSTERLKVPMSQSAAIVVMNISSNPIEICDAGIHFKDGRELHLRDFSLPIKVEARNRHLFLLKASTFEMLKNRGLDKIKYFYVEDPLFNRFKDEMSKKPMEKLLTTYLLDQEPI